MKEIIRIINQVKCGQNISQPIEFKSSFLVHKKITLLKKLRYLAGKRLVCLASYADQLVVVKLFFGSNYKRSWQREKSGCELIYQSGINSPKLLESFCDEKENVGVIVFEFVDKAETLSCQIRKASNRNEQVELYQQAVKLIANMHEQSIYQRDIHLDNFLFNHSGLWLIDGEQVVNKNSKFYFGRWEEENLAMFFSQFDVWETALVKNLFGYYITQRTKKAPVWKWKQLNIRIQKLRRWREGKYIYKKVFRSCTEFRVLNPKGLFCVYCVDFGIDNTKQIINNVKQLIREGHVLKDGSSSSVVKIRIGALFYIVKRYKNKGLIYKVLKSFRKSKAAHSWLHGHLLGFYNIPTPRPVMMVEKRFGLLRGESYVVTPCLEGVHAHAYFNQQTKGDVSSVAKILAEQIHHLHRAGFVHGDLKSTNIWISHGQPYFIDLDGMKKYNLYHAEGAKKDWQRLARDLSKNNIAGSLFNTSEPN